MENWCFLVSYIVYLFFCAYLFYNHVDEDIGNTVITSITIASSFFAIAETLSLVLKLSSKAWDAIAELYDQVQGVGKGKYFLKYEEFIERDSVQRKRYERLSMAPPLLYCAGLVALLAILTLRWSGQSILNNILTTLSFALVFISAVIKERFFKKVWKDIDVMRHALKVLKANSRKNE